MTESFLARHYERFDELHSCSETLPSLCRTFGTEAHRQAAEKIAGWMRDIGLATTTDGWRNVFGRTAADKPTVIIGSHYDTVRDAGAFDGTLGILAGLATLELLGPETVAALPFAVEVAAFSEKEGVRFPATFLGSRAAWGTIKQEYLDLRDADGIKLRKLVPSGWHCPEPRYRAEEILAYLEPHIEQGPVLEAAGQPLAAVSTVVGQKRFTMSYRGEAGHAGTTPMLMRRDALAGAAEWMLATEAFARTIPDMVATVGSVKIVDDAPNVVPRMVRWTLDLRHPDARILQEGRNALINQAREIARRRDLQFSFTSSTDQAPVPLDAALREKITAVLSPGAPTLISGASHDAVMFARRVPTALLFVRCRGGHSHNPNEYVYREDFGVLVMALHDVLLALSVP